jgi:hypothetical protein
MKKRPVSLLDRKAVDAHQELAAAVIRQALLDATNPDAPEDVRAGARDFLAGSPMLHQWCSVAGLDPRLVLTRCLEREAETSAVRSSANRAGRKRQRNQAAGASRARRAA